MLFHNLFLIHYSCFQWQYSIFRSCPVLSFDGKESACNVGDLGSIPGLGRSPGGGHGPLQYSCIGESPWTEEAGRLQSVGSQIVRYDWATKHSAVLSFIDVIWLIALTPYLVTDSGVSGFYLLLSILTFFLDVMTGQWLSLYIYFSTGSLKKNFFNISILDLQCSVSSVQQSESVLHNIYIYSLNWVFHNKYLLRNFT